MNYIIAAIQGKNSTEEYAILHKKHNETLTGGRLSRSAIHYLYVACHGESRRTMTSVERIGKSMNKIAKKYTLLLSKNDSQTLAGKAFRFSVHSLFQGKSDHNERLCVPCDPLKICNSEKHTLILPEKRTQTLSGSTFQNLGNVRFVALLFLICMLASYNAGAQKIDSAHNALGLFAETNTVISDARNSSIGMAGLQYNHHNKKGLGYRLIAAYGSYHRNPFDGYTEIKQDTAIGRYQDVKIAMGFIGAGLEAEKQFYHRLYFFAGFEMRIGYGSGRIDTTVTEEYNGPFINPKTGYSYAGVVTATYDKTGPAATMLFLGFTPYFGLKIAFRRIAIGTEFKNYFNHTSLHSGSSAEGVTDFNSSSVSQSIFIQYKF